ncbi:hypothetical protein A6M27_17575 [Acidithiobacillus thiooxidans]|uniref:hypothetical protein n=2 Tax=Acidithiobacillus thiooxidans TaxID=930 RepID=UPI000466F46E|nr:hypothetical protein [Acidithiobacillus thiooxidans]OCX74933.1 hypothetical protein A6O24_10330 [Acidithiobacillus thiooxidans]OCX77666.1 hypothetical protein A6O26_19355 [Acidithiobacillus thiooxidans]OCX83388.1 hypothetical protein A6M27_17575 [Acidithiobacillus thiooxidans]OFC50215.1 hypothetical protein BAE47_02650 [Acidithiobacillus thiooxidans]
MVPSIITENSLTIFLGAKPVSFDKADPVCDKLMEALKMDASIEELQEIIEAAQRELEHSFEKIDGTGVEVSQDGIVRLDGEPVHSSLTMRMLDMRKEGFDLKPMARFLENLSLNPSYRAVKELYSFLEVGKMPITPDGCFLAFKAVRADYKDIHSGTFDNSIGQVVSMPRNKVDEDSSQTCSAGLHVCSFDYLPHFAHANGHVVLCKVNPRDVVAIPQDYHNTKMRVCQYEVVSEYADYYKEHANVLANSVLASMEDFPFEVEGLDEDGEVVFADSFRKLSEACSYAEDIVEDPDFDRDPVSVRVINRHTDETLLQLYL